MAVESELAEQRRPDLSRYLVHLTKGSEDSLDRSASARDKLAEILTPRTDGLCRLIGKPEGLLKPAMASDERIEKLILAVSLSETPLDYIGHLTQNYSSYGIVFSKGFIREQGGNPAFYVSTKPNDRLRKAVYDLIHVEGYEKRKFAELLPFFNQFGLTAGGWEMDYHYEREWRVPRELRFRHQDVFVGLCETDSDVLQFTSRFGEIPFICPSWSVDRQMEHLRNWKSPSDRRIVYEECRWGRAGVCPFI